LKVEEGTLQLSDIHPEINDAVSMTENSLLSKSNDIKPDEDKIEESLQTNEPENKASPLLKELLAKASTIKPDAGKIEESIESKKNQPKKLSPFLQELNSTLKKRGKMEGGSKKRKQKKEKKTKRNQKRHITHKKR
jgi:hypothetical protein